MKKIIILIVSVWTVSFIAGNILDRNYKVFWRPVIEKFDSVFKDTSKRDIVFEGDSRVHLGINPYYIDSVTGLNSFNSGIGGASIDEVCFLTQSWLRIHAAPKLFVVSVNYNWMTQNGKAFENPCYYFFYDDDPFVRHALDSAGYHATLSRISPILKYTAFDEYNKISVIRAFKGDRFLLPGGISFKGFFNNENGKAFRDDPEAFFIDSPNVSKAFFQTGLEKFNGLLNMIRNAGSRCLIIYPPCSNYLRSHANPLCSVIDTNISLLAKKYGAPILHYDTDNSFDHEYFQDSWHLNISGSEFYSKKLALDILKIMP